MKVSGLVKYTFLSNHKAQKILHNNPSQCEKDNAARGLTLPALLNLKPVCYTIHPPNCKCCITYLLYMSIYILNIQSILDIALDCFITICFLALKNI